MLQISQIYSDYLKRRSREWLIKVDVDGVEYDMSQIVDISISNEIADGYDGFSVGTANISTCTLRLRTTDNIPPNAKVVPYVAISLADMTWDSADYAWEDADFSWDGSTATDWLPLGTFYVDNRKQQGLIWTFECYDGLTFADVAYVSQLDYPTTMQTVWEEVCAQAGLLYDSSVQIDPAHTLNAGPAGYTCRELLSYIAGCHGASVKMSRIGEVSWRTYTADESPDYEMTEADYIRVKQTNPVKSFTRVVVTYDEDDGLYYEAGEGDDNHTLYLTNPLMTQAMTDALLQQVSGFSYVPIEMNCRGYPQLEHGDRISFDRSESLTWIEAGVSWEDADFAWDGIESYQTLILEQTFTFKGGLGMSLAAPSVSEQESEFGIDGSLTAAVKRLNENAVKFGKPYYGVTHSRSEGIVVQREDGLAKAVFNADELSYYAEGQRALWFDVPNRRYKFSGIVEASSFLGGDIAIGSGNSVFKADTRGIWLGHTSYDGAPFYVNMAGQLFATNANITGTITGSIIQGGNVIGATMQGGTITGSTIQTANPGVYPRIELNSGTSVLTAYASLSNYLLIQANYTSSTPALVFINGGNPAGLIQANSSGLSIHGAGGEIRLIPGSRIILGGYQTEFNSWTQIYSSAQGRTLQDELNSLWAAIAAM